MRMFKYCWVWEKTRATGHLQAKMQPMKKTEDIVVFCLNLCQYNPQNLIKGVFNNSRPSKAKKRGGDVVYGQERVYGKSYFTNYPNNIIKIGNPNNNTVHPTQKPVALMKYLIKTYTSKGETVLDFTCGSGTTLVAAKQLGRRYIGIEIEPKYVKIAMQRLALTGESTKDERIAADLPLDFTDMI